MRQVETFEEYETKELRLSDNEARILKDDFRKKLRIFKIDKGRYNVTARQYVGNIVLPEHVFYIRPKIPNLNFFRMLFYTYDLVPEFNLRQVDYGKEAEIFELIINRFLENVEFLVKRGISKGYIEQEDNLPILRGKVLLKEDSERNPVLKNHVFCRFSDFNSDTIENQVLKFTLYFLSQLPFHNSRIVKMTRQLIHFFESVQLVRFTERTFPDIKYNRLTERYKPIIDLCRLILENSSLNFQKSGEFSYSSFLVDMNKLFEKFLLGLLKESLEFKVRSAGRGLSEYALDINGVLRQNPDIMIRKSGRDVLVIDAKYKKLQVKGKVKPDVIIADVRQVWSYCLVPTHKLSCGVLVYPKHLLTEKVQEIHAMKYAVTIIIKTVELSGNSENFTKECNSFVSSIGDLLKSIISREKSLEQ